MKSACTLILSLAAAARVFAADDPSERNVVRSVAEQYCNAIAEDRFDKAYALFLPSKQQALFERERGPWLKDILESFEIDSIAQVEGG